MKMQIKFWVVNRFCLFTFLVLSLSTQAQVLNDITIDSEVTDVQPMTGIVFWPGNNNINTDAVALEYSYMDFRDIVKGKDDYDWTKVDELLDRMASRNHQGILRFRFSYPGRSTTVPQYIKDLEDYVETEGLSEGNTTFFPNWEHPELRRFTLDFFEKYAQRYDKDPRLAFIQVGFGLWAEYHIYSGPFVLGQTFPDKDFQKSFYQVLEDNLEDTYWSISIDAASGTYSPFAEEPDLKNLNFGLFDDSFMHAGHDGYNTSSWNFFDRERFKRAPAGGEFNYYSDFDQENILNENVGAHGIPFELEAQEFHITYMIGNDQDDFQTMERIKEASMGCGYVFKILTFKTTADSSFVEVTNLGVAPIYSDAFVAVNGVRSDNTLKLLNPGEVKVFGVASGGETPTLTIESDDILATQEIQFYGTINDYEPYSLPSSILEPAVSFSKVYPTFVDTGQVRIDLDDSGKHTVSLIDASGRILNTKVFLESSTFDVRSVANGVYFLKITNGNNQLNTHRIVITK